MSRPRSICCSVRVPPFPFASMPRNTGLPTAIWSGMPLLPNFAAGGNQWKNPKRSRVSLIRFLTSSSRILQGVRRFVPLEDACRVLRLRLCVVESVVRYAWLRAPLLRIQQPQRAQ